ncbi:hypothetical protein AB0J30_15210 [Streptomyces microflavus]|uniref:hypothetical protein n=1 Tax=Streptomyces microflavus TaxID=1919 RepID=UPI00341ED72C
MAEIWNTLVGAGAVVVGAGLTGGFTLLKGRQERTDKERDRLEQRITRHREIRREAYLSLLNNAEAVDTLQRDFTMSEEGSPEEFRSELDTASARLHQSLLVVRMEGPSEVADAAQELVRKYHELSGHMRSDDGMTLGDLLTTRIETLNAREEFLRATTKALDSSQ